MATQNQNQNQNNNNNSNNNNQKTTGTSQNQNTGQTAYDKIAANSQNLGKVVVPDTGGRTTPVGNTIASAYFKGHGGGSAANNQGYVNADQQVASGGGNVGRTIDQVRADTIKANQQAEQKATEQKKQQENYAKAAQAENIRINTGQERPAEQAARLAVISKSGSPQFQRLIEQRRQELLAKSGREAYTAHVPQTYVKVDKSYGVSQAQVSGEAKPQKADLGIFENGLTQNDVVTFTGAFSKSTGTYNPNTDKININLPTALTQYSPFGIFSKDQNPFAAVKQTEFHELTHAMDRYKDLSSIFNNKNNNPKLNAEYNKLLSKYEIEKNYSPEQYKAEVIANFGREYFFNPAQAKKDYPEIAKNFEVGLIFGQVSRDKNKSANLMNSLGFGKVPQNPINLSESLNSLNDFKGSDGKSSIQSGLQSGETNRNANIANNLLNNSIQTTQEEKVDFGKGFGQGLKSVFVDYPVSVAKGVAKVFYAPNVFNKGESKPLIDIGQSKLLSSKNVLADKDVQTAGLTTGLVVISTAVPIVGTIAGFTIVGKQLFVTIKNPTGENVGTLTGVIALPTISKGFELFGKSPKAEVISSKGENILTAQGEAGSESLVQTQTKVQVGKKVYDVSGTGKEAAFNVGNNKQVTVGQYDFTTDKAQARQVTSGIRVTSEQGTQSITDFNNAIKVGNKELFQRGTTKSNQVTVVQDSLKTDAIISLSKESKQVKFNSKAFDKTTKQTPSSVEAGLVREMIKDDNVVLSQAKIQEIKNPKVVNKVIDQFKTATKSEVEINAGAKSESILEQKSIPSDSITQLRQGAKSVAKAQYVEEEITPKVEFAKGISKAAVAKVIQKTEQRQAVNIISEQKTKQSPIIKQNVETKQEAAQIQKPISKQIFDTSQKQKQNQILSVSSIADTIQKPTLQSSQLQSQEQIQKPLTETVQVLDTAQKQSPTLSQTIGADIFGIKPKLSDKKI